jgi:Tat protein secretion system quality control protein TatD with DNase activity
MVSLHLHTHLTHCRGVAHIRFVAGLYATSGCHPTRSSEMGNYPELGVEGYLAALDQVISEHLSGVGRIVAVGECGLGTLNPFGERSSDLTLSLRLRPTAFLRRRDTA